MAKYTFICENKYCLWEKKMLIKQYSKLKIIRCSLCNSLMEIAKCKLFRDKKEFVELVEAEMHYL